MSPSGTPKHKIAVVLGTRPEAIKLAPVIQELRRRSFLQSGGDVKVPFLYIGGSGSLGSGRGFYRLDVYDVQGRLVSSLAQQTFTAGEHHVRWETGNSIGTVSPGTYFMRLADDDEHMVTKKVTVVR